jgi:acetylornithine deacetylase/succinyl-diaminopimelate desuccinylase-like protein
VTTAFPRPADELARLIGDRRDDIIGLCLELGNLPDLCGEEIAVSRALAECYAAAGLQPRLQHLSSTSANVVAAWTGEAAAPGARTLILNSHLDTEGGQPTGPPEVRRRLRGTWREDDLLIGKGLVNAKVHLVAQLHAVLALMRAGFSPAGEVLLTGTAQETGDCSAYGTGADEWASPHGHEGAGARWLIENGVLGDFALVGEPTGFAICTAQAGYLRLRVRVTGLMPYTPFLVRDANTGLGGNPVEAAAMVVQAITTWAVQYETSASTDVPGGKVVARAQVQEIRSSFPAFTNHADHCDIFVDVRTPPACPPMPVLRDLAGQLRAAGHEVAVQCCGYRRGYLAAGAEPLAAAVAAGHRAVFGADPPPPAPAQMSMWQDTNAFNEAGIPSVSYGIRPRPERHTREGIRSVGTDDLLALVHVYARAVLRLCGGG